MKITIDEYLLFKPGITFIPLSITYRPGTNGLQINVYHYGEDGKTNSDKYYNGGTFQMNSLVKCLHLKISCNYLKPSITTFIVKGFICN